MPPSTPRLSDRLWRLNAYVIAAAGLIAIVIGIMAIYEISKSVFRTRHVGSLVSAGNDHQSSDKDNNLPARLHVGTFETVAGTAFLRAPVFSREKRSIRHYSKVASGVRNYLFYDTAAGTAHSLLPDGKSLILNTFAIRPPRKGSVQLAPIAMLYTIVRKDSNDDGVLSRRDTASLHISKPGGQSLIQLAGGVNEMLGYHIVSNRELVVMLRFDKPHDETGTVKALHVLLDTFKILREPILKN